jgi:hypothetical protein
MESTSNIIHSNNLLGGDDISGNESGINVHFNDDESLSSNNISGASSSKLLGLDNQLDMKSSSSPKTMANKSGSGSPIDLNLENFFMTSNEINGKCIFYLIYRLLSITHASRFYFKLTTIVENALYWQRIHS